MQPERFGEAALRERVSANVEAMALAVERWLAVDRENLTEVSAAAGWLECHARNLSGAVGDLSALAAQKHWRQR